MENKCPMVSVIVPTYNRVSLLKETIDSILSQTFEDFELIIIDNMSNDGTEDYINQIGDNRIKYIRNPNNGIIAISRNLGIEIANGKYIAFCDDDDLWLPEKLNIQIAFMEKNENLGLSFGYAENMGETIYSGLSLYSKKESDSTNNFDKLFLGNKIATSTVMVRKQCFREVGTFDETSELKGIEDYDLWLRLARSFEISSISEVICKYRVHNANFSKSKVDERIKLLKMIDKFEDKKWANPRLITSAKANIYWMIGNAMLSERNPKYRDYFLQSFIRNVNIKTIIGITLIPLPISLSLWVFNFLENIKIKYSHK